MRAVFAFFLVVAAAGASGYETERARAYFAQELAECGAWFSLVAESPGLDVATKIKFRAAGTSLVSSSADLTSEEWAMARMGEASKAIRKAMDNSWRNFSVVDKQYGQRCRDVATNPRARRQYWLDKRD